MATSHTGGVLVVPSALGNRRELMNLELLQHPALSGILIRAPWLGVEPERGRYDFSMLEPYASAAAEAGKRIALLFLMANQQPAWARNAMRIERFVGQDENGVDREFNVNLPWETAYIDAYVALHRAALAWLESKGWTRHLAYVRKSDQATDGAELGLPRPRGKEDKANPNHPINQQWLALGYRPSLVRNGWMTTLNGMMDVYPPEVRISQVIYEAEGYPTIDETGACQWGTKFRTEMLSSVASNQAHNSRFRVGDASLIPSSQGDPEKPIVELVRARLTPFYQTNHYTKQGAGCMPDKSVPDLPCDATCYTDLLRTGFGLVEDPEWREVGSDTIEIWPEDLERFGKEITAVVLEKFGALPAPISGKSGKGKGRRRSTQNDDSPPTTPPPPSPPPRDPSGRREKRSVGYEDRELRPARQARKRS